MTISENRALHHADPFIGFGQSRVDFEITAHKRYDEKRKPAKKDKTGRRKEMHSLPLRSKSKSRLKDFQ